jgi:putative tryptophan/tyrosine transport system substrate-binding protein
MRRRRLLADIAAATLWRYPIAAQTPAAKRLIAFLSGVSEERNRRLVSALLRGLHELDEVEGRDFVLVSRFAEGQADRLPGLAEELVQLRPNVILAGYTPAAVAARAVTSTIPIVCPLLADPIRLGLIASQPRPGGNVTGVLFRSEGLACKQLEIAAQLIPNLVEVGLLANVASPIDRQDAENRSPNLAC